MRRKGRVGEREVEKVLEQVGGEVTEMAVALPGNAHELLHALNQPRPRRMQQLYRDRVGVC